MCPLQFIIGSVSRSSALQVSRTLASGVVCSQTSLFPGDTQGALVLFMFCTEKKITWLSIRNAEEDLRDICQGCTGNHVVHTPHVVQGTEL